MQETNDIGLVLKLTSLWLYFRMENKNVGSEDIDR
jgi:hypothetical protein